MFAVPTRMLCRSAFAAMLLLCPPAQAAVIVALPGPTLCDPKPAPAAPSDFSREVLCADLAEMGEPAAPVAELGRTVDAYRLIYFRSFHDPIVIRIEIRSDTDATLFAKEAFFRNYNRLRCAQTASLTPAEISDFRKRITDRTFWAAPSLFNVLIDLGPFTTPDSKKGKTVMSEGAEWVVEGLDARRYHVMADDGGVFVDPVGVIGSTLLDLAKEKIPMLNIDPVY